ncbi:uncharacterized protein LOC110843886 [Folsomia candida]|uniref:Putative gamma-butyrobetaine dioxygenase n=1 Tax=Folsomia candida TaxID=158441 RepID=A0A226EQT7_FOLCA|nr:uncharacterized protein LOC110843886 [Folsomia candida]OXA59995.1 putative gamma-butyrobetaine dioxygenase [Folsomia candida]
MVNPSTTSFEQDNMEILWLDGNDALIGVKACEEITKRGIVFVRNIKSEQSLTEISKHFGHVFNPRHGSENGVANIHPDHTLEGKGYTRTALLLHTDRSGMDNPPRFLMTTVKKQSKSGGHSTFVNGRHLQTQILSEDSKLFKLLQSSKMTQFQQEDRSFKPLPMFYGENKIRCRFDDGIYFNHLLAEKLPQLMHHLARLQLREAFKEGEGYILDNHWWLHGRDGFNGDREILRLLINPSTNPVIIDKEGKSTPKLILFDIDGTLLDSQAVSVGAFFKCMTHVLRKEITLKSSSQVNLHGQTDLNLVSEIIKLHVNKNLENSEELVFELSQQFFKLHPAYLENEILENPIKIQPCPGILELVKKIQDLKHYWETNDIHFGLLTGNSQVNALSKIKAAGISQPTLIFDMDKSAFGDTYKKRNDMLPGILGRNSSNVKFSPENTLIVGDTPLDVEC